MDNLTYKEMELLFILLRRSPKVVRRTYLCSDSGAVRTAAPWMSTSFISRQKLGPKAGEQILTVPGQGYKFVPMLFSQENNPAQPHPRRRAAPSATAA